MANVYLANPKPHFMILISKADYKAKSAKRMVQDSTFVIDTVKQDNGGFIVVKNLKGVEEKEETYYEITWNQDFINRMVNTIKPLYQAASKDNVEMSVVMSGVDAEKAKSLADATGLNNIPYYTSDEKLLKTIMRSNPGVILWKNGVLLQKWHYKKLPDYQEIKSVYLK